MYIFREENQLINSASYTGRRHTAEAAPNQDYVTSAKKKGSTVITLADGVSSCKEAKTGARVCGDTATRLLLRKGHVLQDYDPSHIADIALTEILYELEQTAKNEKERIEEYSSTLATVLHDKKSGTILCMSLGDSLILGISGGRCYVLTDPYISSRGCCVTTTKGATSETKVRILDDSELDAVIICSDGAWRKMFENNRIKKEIEEMLAAGDYDGLEAFLRDKDGSDDYSFIAMDLQKSGRSN